MRVSSQELEQNFDRLLDRVEAGETIEIEHNGTILLLEPAGVPSPSTQAGARSFADEPDDGE